MSGDLAERLARVEAIQAIQQLAIRYPIAVDSRDIDSWLGLFPEDVHCPLAARLAWRFVPDGAGRDVQEAVASLDRHPDDRPFAVDQIRGGPRADERHAVLGHQQLGREQRPVGRSEHEHVIGHDGFSLIDSRLPAPASGRRIPNPESRWGSS